MATLLPLPPCFCADHSQLIQALSLNDVGCFRTLWNETLLQSLNAFLCLKNIYFIKNKFTCYLYTPPPPWRCGPTRAIASSLLRFLDHIQRRITVGRTPLDEWSARRRDLYLTTHNTQHRHPCPRGIRSHNRSKRTAVDPRFRPCSHWVQRYSYVLCLVC